MMNRYFHSLLATLSIVAAAQLVFAQDQKPAAAPRITYDEHVRPIFREHCFSCHSADKQESGLQLDSYQKAMAGGSSGEVVLPGDLASSRLWALVSHAEEPKMPPRQDKLAAARLDILSKWIEQGAPENAGSKVVLKKSALSAVASVSVGKQDGPAAMPVSLLKQPVVYTKRPGQVTALAASPWAPLIAVAGQKQVTLYHSESGELLGIVPFPEGIPQVVRFSRNGEVLLIAGGRGGHSGCVVLCDVKSGKRIAKIGDELDAVLAADIDAQQTLVALGGPNRVVRIFSAQTGELMHEIRKHTDWIYAAEFSPDGKFLATADRSGGLFVWEADTARESLSLRGHTGAVTDVAWRFDSNILASAGEDGTVKLWDLNEAKALKSWPAHTGGAFCVRFGHDGRLVSCGRDSTIKTWSTDGAAEKSFPAFAEPALRCAFTHDGGSVLGGDWLGNVKLWNAADAKELRSLIANPPTIAMRLAHATNEVTAKEAAASKAARELTDIRKNATDKRKALLAVTDTLSALNTSFAALSGLKEPTPEAKAAIESVKVARQSAETARERLAQEVSVAQSKLANAEDANKAAVANLELARQAHSIAQADHKAFTEMPAQLEAAATQASKRLEQLTEELAKVQSLAEQAESARKQFAEAYGSARVDANSSNQITASGNTPSSR